MARNMSQKARTVRNCPRLRDIIGEARRNFMCGASRGLVLAAVFAAVCGALAVAQARTVVDFVTEALEFQRSGAAIQITSGSGGVNPAQCDALASRDGIAAAGALRAGSDITLGQLPSVPISSLEATPGFGRLLDMATASQKAWASGVWLTADLAKAVAATPGGKLALADGAQLDVNGVYQWPNDGRSPKLLYQVVAPVAPVGDFDECWTLIWPETAIAEQVTVLPAKSILDENGRPVAPQISQANTNLGAAFNGAARFARLPFDTLVYAGAGCGFALGLVAIRTRRLELAGALHAGVSKVALALQVSIETLFWLALALAPALVGAYYAARFGNTADWVPAFAPAVKTLATATAATLAGSLVAVAFTREKHLFRYFKER